MLTHVTQESLDLVAIGTDEGDGLSPGEPQP